MTEYYDNLFLRAKIFLFLILIIPLVDLYYGFTNTTCFVDNTNKFTIGLNQYLLTSGFVVIIYLMLMIILLLCILYFPYFRLGNIEAWDKLSNITILNHIVNAFLLIWNVLGGVIVWNFVDSNNCDKILYTYLCVTLILKLFFNFFVIYK